MDNWPFDQPRNCATITMRQILDRSEPILSVSHDSDDHGWQFIGTTDANVEDGCVVCLEDMGSSRSDGPRGGRSPAWLACCTRNGWRSVDSAGGRSGFRRMLMSKEWSRHPHALCRYSVSSPNQPFQRIAAKDAAPAERDRWATLIALKMTRWRESGMKVTGGCHCGEIVYEAEVDPENVVICHCTDCQNISGAPYRASVPVRSDDLNLRGNPKIYIKTADSGNKRALAFCGNCGSALYSTTVESPRGYMLRVGAIAQRAELMPRKQGFCRSAMPWAMDIRSIAEV